MELSREHVIWAYRLFLNREPESLAAIDEHLRLTRSIEELQQAFLTSPEFCARHPSGGGFENSNIVIKELPEFQIFVDLADLHVGRAILGGAYELGLQRLINATVQQGQIAVDVGANIGFFSLLLAARVGREGHVFAFEPLAANASLCARSITANGLENRITLCRKAVGAAAGSLQLIHPLRTNNSGGAHLQTTAASIPRDHEATSVPVVGLDDSVSQRPVRFLKIDAEGAERLVIMGAQRILQADRPVVVAEINPRQLAAVSQCRASDVLETMAEQGYRCHPLEAAGTQAPITTYTGDAIIDVVFLPR